MAVQWYNFIWDSIRNWWQGQDDPSPSGPTARIMDISKHYIFVNKFFFGAKLIMPDGRDRFQASTSTSADVNDNLKWVLKQSDQHPDGYYRIYNKKYKEYRLTVDARNQVVMRRETSSETNGDIWSFENTEADYHHICNHRQFTEPKDSFKLFKYEEDDGNIYCNSLTSSHEDIDDLDDKAMWEIYYTDGDEPRYND